MSDDEDAALLDYMGDKSAVVCTLHLVDSETGATGSHTHRVDIIHDAGQTEVCIPVTDAQPGTENGFYAESAQSLAAGEYSADLLLVQFHGDSVYASGTIAHADLFEGGEELVIAIDDAVRSGPDDVEYERGDTE